MQKLPHSEAANDNACQRSLTGVMISYQNIMPKYKFNKSYLQRVPHPALERDPIISNVFKHKMQLPWEIMVNDPHS